MTSRKQNEMEWTPWRLGQRTPSVFHFFGETLVSVHGRFPIARHALLTWLGCRRTSRHAGPKKSFWTCSKLFPRYNVWATFEQNVHRSFTYRYTNAMKSFTSLGYRYACVWCAFVKRWQSFVIYLACYQRVICALSASTERLQNDCITFWWRPHNALNNTLALANRSQNMQVQLG